LVQRSGELGEDNLNSYLPLTADSDPTVASCCTKQITAQWKDLIGMTETQSEVFNIPNWLSRGALDALGNGESF